VPEGDPLLKRWRTPRWYPLVALPLLAALVVVDAGLLYLWLHDRGSGRGSLLLLFVVNAGIAVLLLYRVLEVVVPSASSSRGPSLTGSDKPSNNRWRGP
jgi:hypothetical protein